MPHGHIAGSKGAVVLSTTQHSPLCHRMPVQMPLYHYHGENCLALPNTLLLLKATAVERGSALQCAGRSTASMLWEGDSAARCYSTGFTYTTAAASLWLVTEAADDSAVSSHKEQTTTAIWSPFGFKSQQFLYAYFIPVETLLAGSSFHWSGSSWRLFFCCQTFSGETKEKKNGIS